VVAEAALEDAAAENFDVVPSATAPTEIHLKEDKLHVQLGDKAKQNPGHGRDESHDGRALGVFVHGRQPLRDSAFR
jgi:hypothetical protein